MNAEAFLDTLKEKFYRDNTVLNKLLDEKRVVEEELAEAQKEREWLELQRVLLKDASMEARKQAGQILEDIGTHALQYIFEDKELKIEFNERDEANVWVVKHLADGSSVTVDPVRADGGGYADAVAFSLNIAMLHMQEPKNMAPMFFDEPSKYISRGDKGYAERVARFFYEISTDLDIQIYMVTHDTSLASIAEVAYNLQQNDMGVSRATKIK